MDRQTNRNSNSVINDYTCIKTINILNTVSINNKYNKKSFHDEVPQMLRNAGQTRELIYKLSTLELPFLVLMYSLGNIHTTIEFR